MSKRYGMIHGRFQPFHWEHLEYLRHALERCDILIIGITNPDPSLIVEEGVSQHRHLEESNPYTFFQRLLMIQNTLLEEDIPLERIIIVPFPIHHPERWHYYIPREVVHYLRVFSPWEQEKVERLRSRGYQVEILDPGEGKKLSGVDVRRAIAQRDDWEDQVPPAVARIIKNISMGRS